MLPDPYFKCNYVALRELDEASATVGQRKPGGETVVPNAGVKLRDG